MYVFLLICFVVSFLVFSEIFAFFKKNNGDISIEISKNSSALKIAKVLKDNKIIGNPFLFYNYVKLKNVKLKYGVFKLNSAMNYDELIKILTDDSKNGEFVTQISFYEGSNMFSLMKKYGNLGNFSFLELVKKLNDVNVYSKFNFYKLIKPSQLEGAFFPMEGFCSTSSFNIKNSYNSETVAKLIFSEFDKVVAKFSDEIENSDFDLWEILTIASIIQAESSVVEHMPLISSVLHNRLKNKTYRRLECDVTKKYACAVENELKKMGEDNFKKAENYNTYKCFGLPAGPICNPSYEAIMAAIKPAKTDYNYFCVNLETKKAAFAETFEGHKRNLKNLGVLF